MAPRRHSNHKEGKSFNALKSAVAAARSKRCALVSIHPNLHLPHPMARITRSRSDSGHIDLVETGTKRKRPANAAMRASLKRRKAESPTPAYESETEEEVLEVEENSDSEREHDESDADDSDEFLLHHAPKWRLQKLRKEDLLRLCALAELDHDFETLNKKEVIRLILSARSAGQSDHHSARSSSRDASTSVEQEQDDAEQVGPSRKRSRTAARRPTENFPSTKSRGAVTSRSTSLGNVSERMPTKGLTLRNRTSAQLDHRVGVDHLAQPITILPSPRKTRSRARLQEFANREANGIPSSQSSTSSHSDSDEPIEDPQSQISPPSPRRLRRRNVQSTGHSSTATTGSRPRRKARFEGSRCKDSSDEDDNELDKDDQEGEDDDDDDDSDGDDGTSISDNADEEEGEEPPVSVMDVDSRASREGRRKGAQRETQSTEVDEPEPKVLRSGKVLGDAHDDEAEDSSLETDQSSIDVEDDDNETGNEDGVEEDPGDHEPEEGHEIDIESVNLKTLLRRRRDELLRMCHANDIETHGVRTKHQLAHALLQWRDSTAQFPSSPTEPSSAGTERGINTRKPIRRRSQVLMPPPPVPLLFRDNIHVSEPPATPPISAKAKEKIDEDVEIDLESLGLTDKEIKSEKIQKLDKIGSGGFKDVYLGKYHGRKVAIAEFRGQLSAMDIKELKLLREFNHPNVVKFYGVSVPADTRSTPVMIISELCPNGDLFDFIRNTPPPNLRSVLLVMRDIARGIEYLHLRTPSIIHRDCKSSNILITSKNTAKITDFGLAKVKQSTRSMVRSLVGTVNWQAPELWHPHPKYDHKVDVFSCAMVYWEMLQWHQPKKTYPWEGMNEHAIYDVVGRKGQRPSMHGMRKLWCPEIVELIERMWAQEPRDRPTISDVVHDLGSILSKY